MELLTHDAAQRRGCARAHERWRRRTRVWSVLWLVLLLCCGGAASAESPRAPSQDDGLPRGALISIWQEGLGRHIGRGICIDAGQVAVATLDRRCALLDARSGREIWSRRRGGGIQAGVTLTAEAVLGVTDFPHGELFCLERATGRERWSVALGEAWGPPLVAGADVFAASLPGRVACVALADGRQRWQRQMKMRLRAPLALRDSLLLVPTLADSLIALHAQTGDFVWGASPGGALYGPPRWAGGRLWTLSFEGLLSELDLRSGRILAARRLDGFFRSGLAARGATLAAVSTAGTLFVLDATSGLVRWRRDLESASDLSPTLDDETVWVGLLSGAVHAFRLSDGRALTMLSVTPPVAAPIAIGGGLHVIAGGNGVLVAYRWSGRMGESSQALPLGPAKRRSLRALSSPPRGLPASAMVALAAHHFSGVPATVAPAAQHFSEVLAGIGCCERGSTAAVGKGRHWLRWFAALGWVAGAGAALWLQHEADNEYDVYLRNGDPDRRERALDRAETYDRGALGAWVASQGFFVFGLWAWLRES